MSEMMLRTRVKTAAFAIILSVIPIGVPAHAGSWCVASSPPRVGDAFFGIVDRNTLSPAVTSRIANASQLSAAVILSENTKKQIAWSKQAMAGASGVDRALGSFFGGSKAVEEGDRLCQIAHDPKFITDRVMQPLVHRFHDVKVISDFSGFTQGPYDVLVLIDVVFADVFNDGFFIGEKYEANTEINAYFINRNNALIGRIESGLKRKAHRSEYIKQVAEVRTETLDQYQAAVAKLLGPDPNVSSPPPLAAVGSVADRLRAVEDLLRQGLITPEEAAQKKAEILKAL